MAKRETSAGRMAKAKPKDFKRETNAQRAAREDNRRNALELSEMVTNVIRDRKAKKVALETRISLPKRKRWQRWPKTYYYLGALLCEYSKDLPEVLRLVADRLEGRPPYSPGNDWYDGAITQAYEKAEIRYTFPTFAEFEKVFWEQNPKLYKTPSERSLRRSLRRLGYTIEPTPAGRPNVAITQAYETARIRYIYPSFSEFLKIYREQNPKMKVEERSLRQSLRRLDYMIRPANFRPHGRAKEK
jgi:hypothetical protein